jgi:MFS family permease
MFLIRRESQRTGQDSPAGVLTALAVSAQTVAVIGPTLGGLLIGLSGWHAIFFVNVPLALACLALGALRLPKMPAPQRKTSQRLLAAIDLGGIVLFTATLTALLLYLMNIRVDTWYLLVITIAAGAGLVWWELKAAQPFIDLRVLGGNHPLLLTYFRNLLTYVVSYAFIYGYTQWLEQGRGLSATTAGLVLLPMFLTAIVVSSITGRRKEIRAKLIVGGFSQIIACALLLFLHAGSALWLLLLIGLVIGIPQGLNNLANQNAVYYQADPDRIGSSAGLLRTSTYLGAIVASAANGVFLNHGADTGGLHGLALFILVIAALFFAISLADRSLTKIRATTDSSSQDSTPQDPSAESPTHQQKPVSEIPTGEQENSPERTHHGAHRTR